jgi:hypothetical protein
MTTLFATLILLIARVVTPVVIVMSIGELLNRYAARHQ